MGETAVIWRSMAGGSWPVRRRRRRRTWFFSRGAPILNSRSSMPPNGKYSKPRAKSFRFSTMIPTRNGPPRKFLRGSEGKRYSSRRTRFCPGTRAPLTNRARRGSGAQRPPSIATAERLRSAIQPYSLANRLPVRKLLPKADNALPVTPFYPGSGFSRASFYDNEIILGGTFLGSGGICP